MAAETNLGLRLILYNLGKDSEASSTVTTWNPTDNLHGQLEISSVEDLTINEVTVYFEGVSRNWISSASHGTWSPKIMKAERKFLSQAQDIPPSMVCRVDSQSEGLRYTTPFHFIISRMLPSSDPYLPDQCLQLPPSLELGGLFVDENTGNRFAQPCIAYHLRATVSASAGGQGVVQSIETSVPVVVMPYTQEFPPTETSDFPTEFKEQESKIIRRSLIGGILGRMNISMREPSALTYDILATESTTMAHMKLEFEGSTSDDIFKSLQSLTFTILSLIRVKTFYSIRSFPRLPSQSILRQGGARLRDDLIKLDTQNLRNVSWGHIYDTGNDLQGFPFDSTINVPSVAGVLAHGEGRRTNINPRPPRGKWIAILTVPIRINTRLLPTFCSSLVARIYSVLFRVKISGGWNESFDLEVPLQVVHAPPKGLFSGQLPVVAGSLEPIQEDLTSMALRRASTTSWFSSEPLETDEMPPNYYT